MTFLFISCSEETTPLPLSDSDAKALAAEIRRNPQQPHDYILSLYEKSSQVEFVDYPGFTGVVDLLEYLMPLLYDRGIGEYDLWFIPEDGLDQVNAILTASRFFPDSAAELVGRVSYLYQFQEYVDLLEAMYDFNKTLSPDSQPLRLVNSSFPPSGPSLTLSKETPRLQQDAPLVHIQSPPLFKKLEEGGNNRVRAGINQVASYLEGGENLYIIDEAFDMGLLEETMTLIMLKRLGDLTLCHPYEGGINSENALSALKDFPEIKITAPTLSVPLMKRAQRRFLQSRF